MVFFPILQTIQDKNNPDYVEEHGPFLGERNTWLGRGYYFWERFVEIAHWWGNSHCSGNYMICSASVSLGNDELLDLVNSTEDMDNFRKTCEEVARKYSNQQPSR